MCAVGESILVMSGQDIGPFFSKQKANLKNFIRACVQWDIGLRWGGAQE